MWIEISADLHSKFPGLQALSLDVSGVEIVKESNDLESFKKKIIERANAKWTIDQLREFPIFRSYRDFFWRVGVDPTKTRPASEALIRRVLRGKQLPIINTCVDAYNLASIETAIPLAAFDEGELEGELFMRAAKPNEEFLGIGMKKPVILGGGEPVITDGERLVAIYPYRDAEICKITQETNNVRLLVCGVPNIEKDILVKAGKIAVEWVTQFCGGLLV